MCISIGCETRYANPHPEGSWTKIRYSPLNTPLDEDIQYSQASEKQAIVETGHNWTPPDDGQFV